MTILSELAKELGLTLRDIFAALNHWLTIRSLRRAWWTLETAKMGTPEPAATTIWEAQKRIMDALQQLGSKL